MDSSKISTLVDLVVVLCMVGLSWGALVEEQPLVLKYHNGPLLTVKPAVDVHVIWYGDFSPVQRSIVGDFIESLGGAAEQQPSVSTWWKTTEGYRGGAAAASNGQRKTRLGVQKLDQGYSLGKLLKRNDITSLARRLVSEAGNNTGGSAVYLVLTAKDVAVERFCMSSCGFHDRIVLKGERRVSVPFAWVGNSEVQCPGQCAWPFHQPIYGPQTPPLLPPNGDVGIDGMVINIATVLAGAVTNPFNTGYFQGDAAAPLEAVSACPGIYGKGAYPGNPGDLLVGKTTGASFNAYGLNGRAFLVPAMWDPSTRSCKTTV